MTNYQKYITVSSLLGILPLSIIELQGRELALVAMEEVIHGLQTILESVTRRHFTPNIDTHVG